LLVRFAADLPARRYRHLLRCRLVLTTFRARFGWWVTVLGSSRVLPDGSGCYVAGSAHSWLRVSFTAVLRLVGLLDWLVCLVYGLPVRFTTGLPFRLPLPGC